MSANTIAARHRSSGVAYRRPPRARTTAAVVVVGDGEQLAHAAHEQVLRRVDLLVDAPEDPVGEHAAASRRGCRSRSGTARSARPRRGSPGRAARARHDAPEDEPRPLRRPAPRNTRTATGRRTGCRATASARSDRPSCRGRRRPRPGRPTRRHPPAGRRPASRCDHTSPSRKLGSRSAREQPRSTHRNSDRSAERRDWKQIVHRPRFAAAVFTMRHTPAPHGARLPRKVGPPAAGCSAPRAGRTCWCR